MESDYQSVFQLCEDQAHYIKVQRLLERVRWRQVSPSQERAAFSVGYPQPWENAFHAMKWPPNRNGLDNVLSPCHTLFFSTHLSSKSEEFWGHWGFREVVSVLQKYSPARTWGLSTSKVWNRNFFPLPILGLVPLIYFLLDHPLLCAPCCVKCLEC